MRWLLRNGSEESGPMEDAMVAALAKAGQINSSSQLREESATEWVPFDKTPFAILVASPVAAPIAKTEQAGGAGGRIFAALVLSSMAGAAGFGLVGPVAGFVAGIIGLLVGILFGSIKL